MSKKDQVPRTPLEMFTGHYQVSLVTGKVFTLEVTGAFADAIVVRDGAGYEGIIPWHGIAMMIEVKNTITGEEEDEATQGV